MAARLYVGGLPQNLSEKDLEDEFIRFGTLRSVWVARKPPGFAFIEFEDVRDAEDAVRKLDGFNGWRVEFSRKGERGPPRGGGGYGGGPPDRYGGGGYGGGGGGAPRGGGGGGGGGGFRSEMKCYECGETGHFARDCRERMGGGGGGGGGPPRGRVRSRSPIRRRSPSEPRRRSRSPSYGRDSPPPRRSRSRSLERSPID